MSMMKRRKNYSYIAENKGYEEGIEDGSLQKAIEIAKAMLKDNVPIEVITKFTKLNIEEIEKLREEK